jgi:hypothetical protein
MLMAAKPAHAPLDALHAALLRERLQRFAAMLDKLDDEQLATIDELVSILERLTALLDETPTH